MLLAPLLLGCVALLPRPAGFEIHSAPPPSEVERYCAWFGDARGDTLYFGESAFWSAARRGGPPDDPRGDLAEAGPVLVGRFDLDEERLLEPLRVAAPGARAGVWDVLAHPNGRLFFTSYFETSGWIDPETGATELLPELGSGLNELTLGPEGRIFATRYALPDAGGGVVVLDPEGRLLTEHPLSAPPGYRAGPKSVAVDPLRGDIWLSMDLLPEAVGPEAGPIRHDAYVLDATGTLLRSFERPHLHFPAFAVDGTGYRAEVEDGELALRVVEPDSDPRDADAGVRIVLDAAFPEDVDFVQDVRPLPGGGALLSRWSGTLHRVDASGRARTLRLPRPDPSGLYYTAVLHDGRVCATYCGDVTVVCRNG